MPVPKKIAVAGATGRVGHHAVVGSNAMDDFEIRLLDFASVNEAKTRARFRKAGLELARLAR